jgi:hypothetical protein
LILFQRLREKNEAAKKAKEEAEAKALSEFMEKAILGHATRSVLELPSNLGLILPSAKTEKNPVFCIYRENIKQTNFSCKTEKNSLHISWYC